MDRRRFLLTSLAGVLVQPLAAEAQQAGKVPRVGFLSALHGSDPQVQRSLDAFRQGLRDLRYVEGQSITIEYRWAEGKVERLLDLATQLVRLNVDVIVASGGLPVAQAAQQATKAIPIIMTGPADPVAAGLVASLARPGGNITGLAIISHELVGKELELLREVVPRVSRVAVLWNPTNPGNTLQMRAAEVSAQALGVRLQSLEARGPGEIDQAFAAMTRERAGALLVLLDSMLLAQRGRIADLAAKNRLPAVYGLRLHADAGGLMAYAASPLHVSRRIASYVDRILKGAKPADLPVEQPTEFEKPRPDAKLPQRRRRAKTGGRDFVTGQNSHDGTVFRRTEDQLPGWAASISQDCRGLRLVRRELGRPAHPALIGPASRHHFYGNEIAGGVMDRACKG